MKYHHLVGIYEKLEATTKRLEKTHIISEFLKEVPDEDLEEIMLLLQGKLYTASDESKIGVASKLLAKAINVATGISLGKINSEWKKTGDLGIVAQNLVSKKSQSTLAMSDLIVRKVFQNLKKLAEMEGTGTVDRKLQLIAELLTSATPSEAKYICRTILGELRIGVGDGSLRDSIVWANFGKELKISYNRREQDIEIQDRKAYNEVIDAVQHAYDLSTDWRVVAMQARKGMKDLEKVPISVGNPIKCMLAIKVKDVAEGFERVGKPAAIEYKLDGFRLQIHKKNDKITIFTRRLENVTTQFPEVIEYVRKHVEGDSFILDSEAVGFNPKTKRYEPFQYISQRIRRKYDIERLSKELPVELNIFDILYFNGKNMIPEPFEARRRVIKKMIIPSSRKIVLTKQLVTDDEKKAHKFYEDSLKAGNEGVMMKSLGAPYKPGARVGYMVKLKSMMETLDLVIVGAEWGEGKRSNWLSSFTLACRGEKGEFLEVGRVGTGIKEKEEQGGVTFMQLTKLLKKLIIEEKGKYVNIKPKVLVEINYEEIQKSPTYTSGYALRFPRVVRLREDKGIKDVSSLKEVEEFYKEQKK